MIDIICGAHYNPEFYACAELFDHPQAKEILEIIGEETKGSSKKIYLSSIFGNFDSNLHDALRKIKLYLVTVSANFLEPGARSKYMNSKDPDKEISNIIDFLNKFYDHPGKITVPFLYASNESIKKSCSTIKTRLSEEAKQKIFSFILTELSYTQYSPRWLQEDLKNQTKKYLEATQCYIDSMGEAGIKNNLLVWNLNSYFPIQQIMDDYNEFDRTRDFYYEIFTDFNKSMHEALKFVEESGYDLSDVGFIVGPSMEKTARLEYPELNWVKVQPDYYSGNVTTTLLITFSDIRKYIELHEKKYSLYVFTKKINSYITDVAGKTISEELSDINIELF
jgi:hypothetical protein